MNLPGYYNIEPNLKLLMGRNALDDEESKAPMKINLIQDSSRRAYRDNMFSDYSPASTSKFFAMPYSKQKLEKIEKEIPRDVIPYNELGFFKKLIRNFTPFELMTRKVWVPDAFLYPQLFMTCIVISYLSIFYLTYETIKFVYSLTKYIDDAYDQVYKSAYSFLRVGLNSYYDLMHYEPTSKDLDDYYDRLREVNEIVDELVIAIEIGAYIGITIAFIAVCLNAFWLTFDYKRRFLDARKGIYKLDKSRIPIFAYINVSGAIISNSVFIFFINVLI